MILARRQKKGGEGQPKEKKSMQTANRMVVYNLFPLLAGPFSAWERHFRRAAEMGFNWIFVNPIHKPGLSGSLYATQDYYRFNPLLIDGKNLPKPEAQVRRMAEKAREQGLKLMIDLVINHCSIDSSLIQEHPRWFLWETEGKVAHPWAKQDGKKVVWGDLAKFDFTGSPDKEGLFQFFSAVVKNLMDLGFEGFRCDAAYQIPASFWRRLIQKTKETHPSALFIAETLGCTVDQTRKTAKAGFDYIFNSSKWWDFRKHWLMEQYNLTREICPSIGFPESHDTARLCEELQGNLHGLKQRYLFSALFSAGVMIPVGFEFGFRKKLDVVKTRPGDWENTAIDLTAFIRKVNEMKAAHEIFQEESCTDILSNSNSNVLLMRKAGVQTQEESLLILNKDIHDRQSVRLENVQDLVQGSAPLVDISPEDPLPHIPAPFSYDLRPGQGIVLVTRRDAVEDD
jgi:starch synthase (maltosyl-transferring)